MTFGGEIVGVEWAGADARRATEIAFAGLQTSDDRLPDVTLRVGARPDPPMLTLFEGCRCLYRGVSVGSCAHLLLQAALDSLISRSAGGIVVHAALVGRGDAGVLLPGATGSGKTMLCARLMQRGLAYFSDEACYVAAGTQLAGGFARPLCFRGSWAEPLGLQPADTNGESGGEGVSLVPSGDWKTVCSSGSIVPRLVVFPNFQPGAPLAMTQTQPGTGRRTPSRDRRELAQRSRPWRRPGDGARASRSRVSPDVRFLRAARSALGAGRIDRLTPWPRESSSRLPPIETRNCCRRSPIAWRAPPIPSS